MEKAIAGVDQSWTKSRAAEWEADWKRDADERILKLDPRPEGNMRLNKGSNSRDRAELLTQITGDPACVISFSDSDSQLLSDIRARLDNKKPVLVSIRDQDASEHSFVKDLQDGHAYE